MPIYIQKLSKTTKVLVIDATKKKEEDNLPVWTSFFVQMIVISKFTI